MPSIYTNLKSSDRTYIRKEKSRIRRQFLDVAKQDDMINELYKRMVPAAMLGDKKKATEETKATEGTKAVKPAAKKVAAKATKKVKA